MPRFAANITTMFQEWSFLDRIQAASDMGFSAVECQFPYDKSPDSVATALADAGIPMVLINAPAGGAETGNVGLAANPALESKCRESIDLAHEYCKAIKCRQVHLMAGVQPSGVSVEQCRSAFVRNIRYAADVFKGDGMRVMLEPINNLDIPEYFLFRLSDAVAVIDEVGRDNVGLQFDVYHAVRMGENLRGRLIECASLISHVQISDCPGRHEPGSGSIDYPALFDAFDNMGYTGWVGCEYAPASGTLNGLGWAKKYGIGVDV